MIPPWNLIPNRFPIFDVQVESDPKPVTSHPTLIKKKKRLMYYSKESGEWKMKLQRKLEVTIPNSKRWQKKVLTWTLIGHRHKALTDALIIWIKILHFSCSFKWYITSRGLPLEKKVHASKWSPKILRGQKVDLFNIWAFPKIQVHLNLFKRGMVCGYGSPCIHDHKHSYAPLSSQNWYWWRNYQTTHLGLQRCTHTVVFFFLKMAN